jgi:peroxiredoxin
MNRLPKVILPIALASALASVIAAAACSSDAAPNPGKDPPASRLEVDLLGDTTEFLLDARGALQSPVELTSADGRITLLIDEGTAVTDEDGKPLQAIRVAVDDSPPPPPDQAFLASPVYELAPRGAAFDPQLRLALGYDPADLPDGSREDDLYVACHDGSEWRRILYKRVDTGLHSVSTHLSALDFTGLALLGPEKPAASPPPTANKTQGAQVGNLAPDFELDDLDGNPVRLSDLRGRPVMLNFWATWCGPCRSEMADIQSAYEEWAAEDLALLTVNMGGTSSQVAEFLEDEQLSLPVLLDTKQDVAGTYNVRYVPTTFFLDADGVIQAVKVGAFPDRDSIETELEKIMP